jgi:hypothetical protein
MLTPSRPSVPILFRLVWREFKLSLIHEYLYRFRSDDRRKEKFWLGDRGGVHYFRSVHNRHLAGSFPVPERGGTVEAAASGLAYMTIYMDDLHLCPKCGTFAEVPDDRYPTLICGRPVDRAAVRNAIEERRSAPEFAFEECAEAERCRERRAWFDRELREAEERRRSEAEHKEFLARLETERQAELARIAALAARPVFVYAMEGNGHVKIGRSLNVAERLKSVRTGCPFPVVLLRSWVSSDPVRHEARLHARFAPFRTQGEWFRLPAAERASLLAIDALD